MEMWQSQMPGDYHELPEFLRFNRYGGVLTREERERVAKAKGVCPVCGAVTHKVTPFRSIPLNGDHVHDGVCLKCHPEMRPVKREKSTPAATGGKAAKLLGEGRGNNLGSSVMGSRRAASAARRHGSAISNMSTGKKTARQIRQRFHADSNLSSTSEETTPHRQKSNKSLGTTATEPPAPSRPPGRNPRAAYAARFMRRSANGGKQFAMSEPPPASDDGLHSTPEGSERENSSRSNSDMNRRSYSSGDALRESATFRESITNDAWDLVKEMRDHPDDVERLTSVCHSLRNLGNNQSGSLYEVIEVMRRFPDERTLQRSAVGALWSLSADGGDDHKTEIIEAGGAEVIVDAMRNFPEDAALLSWGLGALSSYGEGMGGRAYLEDVDVVGVSEEALKAFHDARPGTEVLYWVFRCLVTLVCDYDGNALGSAGVRVDNDENEDIAAATDYRDAVANCDIIPLAWQSAHSAAQMDGVALEMAFRLLAHFDIETHVGVWSTLGACERAVRAKPPAAYPVLHHLACAFLCLSMTVDSFDREELTAESDFLRVALDALSDDRDRSLRLSSLDERDSSSSSLSSDAAASIPNFRDVMICTLSHLLCFGGLKLGFSESNDTLKICSLMLEDEDSGIFLQGSCIWILWCMFSRGMGLGSVFVSGAAEGIQRVLSSVQKDPVLLTVAFSALSQVVTFIRFKKDNQFIETVVRLVSGYIETITQSTSDYEDPRYHDARMLRREACQLLCRTCKTRESALRVASSGWLQVARMPLSADGCEGGWGSRESVTCRSRDAVHAHLLIKLHSMGALPAEDHETVIDATAELNDVSPLAAKSWLGHLSESVTPDEEDFRRSSAAAVESIEGILEAFPKNVDVQKLGLAALRNMAALIQEADLPLDVSSCIRSALDSQKEHGDRVHEECCGALWALMGVNCELDSALLREVVYFAIEVTEIHILSSDRPFSESIVSAGMAIFANMFSNPVTLLEVLGEKIIDIIVDVVNTTIYTCLDKRGNFPRIYELAFRTLSRLSTNDACRDIIVHHGGIVAVVDGMMENVENACIQECGCNILRHLAGNDLEMKLKIVEADGVDVIMNIMISHGEKFNVLSEAFQALSCLSVDKTSRNFIAQQGGVMLIANSMSMLQESVELQETGLAALCNLASDVEEDILEASDIYAVVNDSLSRNAETASVQRQGLALLYNLSLRSGGMRGNLVSSGCLRNITRAVEIHMSNPKVLSSALSMLINLSDIEECERILREEKTVDLIVHAIALNVENLKIATIGCNVLDVICEASLPNETSIGFRAVEVVVYAMNVHYSSECVQDTGCGILSCSSSQSFISNNGGFDIDLFDTICKMVEVILTAMSSFPSNFQVQLNATMALSNMSKLEENIAVLETEHDLVEIVLKQAMARFPECERNCREVLEALEAA